MSRLTNTLLQSGSGTAEGLLAPTVDLSLGGYGGYAPDITSYLSNTIYVPKPLIPVVLEAPKGFQYMREPDRWLAQLKNLFEVKMKSIQGLNRTLEVEVNETQIGGSGEIQQDPLDVKATRSQISYQWDEVAGMAIANFMDIWIRMFIMDPNTKIANIFTQSGNKPTDQLPDLYSMSMMFIEPDQSMTGVINAYLCTNMYPLSTGEITSRRDMTSPSELRTHDIQFASITQTGAGVKVIAQNLLRAMNMSNANPATRAAFLQQIEPDILKLTQGYKNSMESVAVGNVRT